MAELYSALVDEDRENLKKRTEKHLEKHPNKKIDSLMYLSRVRTVWVQMFIEDREEIS
jgi:hypothetical protein